MEGSEGAVRCLYHGSLYIVERPEYGRGKPYNDYGLGFYCTETPDMAKEWAAARNRNGFANRYELDCTGLDILDLSQSCGILGWLAVLLENRTFDAPSALAYEAREYLKQVFTPDYRGRDCIVGYRADDSYFSFAQDFINGAISYRRLGRAMRLGKLGEQFVLKSERAFERIEFKGYEIVRAEEWYGRKMARDRAARRAYFDRKREHRMKGDIYITQILDEEMTPDDPRLR